MKDRTLRARLPNGRIVAIAPSMEAARGFDERPHEAEHLASLLDSPLTREADLVSFLANVTPIVFPESEPTADPRSERGPGDYGFDLSFPLAEQPGFGVVEIKTQRSRGMTVLEAAAIRLQRTARQSILQTIALGYLIVGRGSVSSQDREMATRSCSSFPITIMTWDDVFRRLGGGARPSGDGRTPVVVVLVEVVNMSRQLLRALVREPSVLGGIDDRQFEQLVATLLFDLGLQDVELTPSRKDGGRDIIAVHVNEKSGERQVYLIECKHWVSGAKVTMRWAVMLLDIVARENATAAVLLSSSGFGPRLVEHEAELNTSGLFLKDSRDLSSWIKIWERQYGAIIVQPKHPAEVLGLRPDRDDA